MFDKQHNVTRVHQQEGYKAILIGSALGCKEPIKLIDISLDYKEFYSIVNKKSECRVPGSVQKFNNVISEPDFFHPFASPFPACWLSNIDAWYLTVLRLLLWPQASWPRDSIPSMKEGKGCSPTAFSPFQSLLLGSTCFLRSLSADYPWAKIGPHGHIFALQRKIQLS